MAVVTHGVSTNTHDRLLIDAGAVYVDFVSVASPGTLLGATAGGNTFEVARDILDPRPDGSLGPIKGFRRRGNCIATLTVNLLEITEENLLYALPGAAASTHVITGAEIDDSDFHDVALVGNIYGFTMTSAPIILVVENAIPIEPISFGLTDKGETVIVIKWQAHYLSTALDTEPWSITYPS